MRSIVVSRSACLPARKPHAQTSQNVLHSLLVAMAWSSSHENAVPCVLPVLWMTSFFYIMRLTGQKQERFFVELARWRQGGVVWCLRLLRFGNKTSLVGRGNGAAYAVGYIASVCVNRWCILAKHLNDSSWTSVEGLKWELSRIRLTISIFQIYWLRSDEWWLTCVILTSSSGVPAN